MTGQSQRRVKKTERRPDNSTKLVKPTEKRQNDRAEAWFGGETTEIFTSVGETERS